VAEGSSSPRMTLNSPTWMASHVRSLPLVGLDWCQEGLKNVDQGSFCTAEG
ncbi:hypothetical protein GOODEAATRI_020601, partial [Goodea atripinnis]